MKILITGSSGFIGSNLILHLHKKVKRIYGVDNFNNKIYPSIYKRFRSDYLKKINVFKEYELDISNLNSLESIFKTDKIDAVIHLAAHPGVRISNDIPNEYIDNNINNFINIITLAKNYNSLFIYASSSSIYNKTYNELPFSDLDENFNPDSIYGLTKLCNEKIANIFFEKYKYPSVGLRLFSIYGLLSRPDMALFSFMKSIYLNKSLNLNNDGKSERDYTSIKTVCDIVYKILINERPLINNEVYNIGNNKPVLTKSLFTEIKKMNKSFNGKIIKNKVLEQGTTFAITDKIENKYGEILKYNIYEEIPKIYEWSIKNKYFEITK